MPTASSTNTTSLQGMAKELYPVEEIKRLEQLFTSFKQEVEEDSDLDFSPSNGGTFKFAVKAFGPHAQKMVNEQEALPIVRSSSVKQGTSTLKEYVGMLQFTKRELELAKKGPKAFADAKTLEMEGLIENYHKYCNRQIADGTGVGTITTVVGAQAAQTVIEVLDASRFQIGMVIDIFNAAGTVKQIDGVVVTDIDMTSTTNTITIDTSSSCDDLGLVCLSGVRDNMSTDGKEMLGLPLFVDDGSLSTAFEGIDRTGADAVPNWRGISLSAASAPLSVALINQLVTRAYRLGGTDFVKMNDVYFLMSPEQWRSYASLSVPQIRFAPSDSGDMNKSFTQYECMGKRVVLDTDVSRTKVYIIKKSALKMATAKAADWESELGGSELKWLSGTTQGVMILYALHQMYTNAPRDMAALTTLETVAI